MKALTIRQPHASLIAEGVKTIETRSWSTSYRGRIAVHAGKAEQWAQGQRLGQWAAYRSDRSRPARMYEDGRPGAHGADGVVLPLGAVVATAVLTDCVPMLDDRDSTWEVPTIGRALLVRPDSMSLWYRDDEGLWTYEDGVDNQRPLGDFAPGRWAWLLEDVKRCEPVPARGRQGLWNWEPAA